MWWAVAKFVAVIVASYVIARVTAKQPKSNRPTAAEDDWNMPVPDEGTPQCVFFGDCWTADWFVLGYGNYRYSAIRK